MSDDRLLSPEMKTTFVFASLGVVCWYAAGVLGAGEVAQLAVLFGVGVVVPLLVNQRRRRGP